jgi:hypothetical protein
LAAVNAVAGADGCRQPAGLFAILSHSVPRCREREDNFASPDWIELVVVVVFLLERVSARRINEQQATACQ